MDYSPCPSTSIIGGLESVNDFQNGRQVRSSIGGAPCCNREPISYSHKLICLLNEWVFIAFWGGARDTPANEPQYSWNLESRGGNRHSYKYPNPGQCFLLLPCGFSWLNDTCHLACFFLLFPFLGYFPTSCYCLLPLLPPCWVWAYLSSCNRSFLLLSEELQANCLHKALVSLCLVSSLWSGWALQSTFCHWKDSSRKRGHGMA